MPRGYESVFVHSGADGTRLYLIRGRELEGDLDRFGDTVEAAGDLNGDGTPDFAVGSRGVVHLFDGVDGDELATIVSPLVPSGPSPGDPEAFGAQVVVLDRTLVVGSPSEDEVDINESGRAYVVALADYVVDAEDRPTASVGRVRTYPNPTAETATARVLLGSTALTVVDALGRRVLSRKLGGTTERVTIDLAPYPAGVYSVVVAQPDAVAVGRVTVIR